MVPSIICMWDGSNSHSVGVVLIETCRYHPLLQTLIQAKNFFISSTFSVFNIKFIQSVFWISKIECIFAVKCCELVFFLYIRHEFDTAINAIFIKNFSKDFPYLFVRRRATTTELFFCCFSIITFFQCCGIFNFWILPSLLRHSQFKGFFNICKWSKNACPTFLKKICILRVWM